MTETNDESCRGTTGDASARIKTARISGSDREYFNDQIGDNKAPTANQATGYADGEQPEGAADPTLPPFTQFSMSGIW